MAELDFEATNRGSQHPFETLEESGEQCEVFLIERGAGSTRVRGFPRWMKPKSGRHLKRVRTYLDTMATTSVVTTGLLKTICSIPLGRARVKTAAGGAQMKAVTVMVSPEVRAEGGCPNGAVRRPRRF